MKTASTEIREAIKNNGNQTGSIVENSSIKAKTTKTTIECKCGIYDTEVTIRDYGHKVCITTPYIKWTGNAGCLNFEKSTFTDTKHMGIMRDFAKAESICLDTGDSIFNYTNF